MLKMIAKEMQAKLEDLAERAEELHRLVRRLRERPVDRVPQLMEHLELDSELDLVPEELPDHGAEPAKLVDRLDDVPQRRLAPPERDRSERRNYRPPNGLSVDVLGAEPGAHESALSV